MSISKEKLIEAEAKALYLFKEIEARGIIAAFKTEKQINTEIHNLAFELFGIKKYWHKRIVRAGANTLSAYSSNPANLTLQEDDILFIDFGPIFEDWEADFGRTYVIGNDPYKIKLRDDLEKAWNEIKDWFEQQTSITGSELFYEVLQTTKRYGWTFGSTIAGHLIGQFPHEKIQPKSHALYIHKMNYTDMLLPDANGNKRHWILEVHFVDKQQKIGGFFEQLLC